MTEDEDPDGPNDLMHNPEITKLIQQLSNGGMSLPAIKGLIKKALQDKLNEPAAPTDPPGGCDRTHWLTSRMYRRLSKAARGTRSHSNAATCPRPRSTLREAQLCASPQ
jgi:hypothetical protein